MQAVVHYFLHLVFPVFIALLFYKHRWQRVYLMMLATIAIDLDHLLASPIFDACRCSIAIRCMAMLPYFAIACCYASVAPGQ